MKSKKRVIVIFLVIGVSIALICSIVGIVIFANRSANLGTDAYIPEIEETPAVETVSRDEVNVCIEKYEAGTLADNEYERPRNYNGGPLDVNLPMRSLVTPIVDVEYAEKCIPNVLDRINMDHVVVWGVSNFWAPTIDERKKEHIDAGRTYFLYYFVSSGGSGRYSVSGEDEEGKLLFCYMLNDSKNGEQVARELKNLPEGDITVKITSYVDEDGTYPFGSVFVYMVGED